MFEDIKKAVYNTVAKDFGKSLVLLDCKVVSIKDMPSQIMYFSVNVYSYDYYKKTLIKQVF